MCAMIEKLRMNSRSMHVGCSVERLSHTGATLIHKMSEYTKGSYRPAICDSPSSSAVQQLHYRAPARRRHGRAHPHRRQPGPDRCHQGTGFVGASAGGRRKWPARNVYDAVICLSAVIRARRRTSITWRRKRQGRGARGRGDRSAGGLRRAHDQYSGAGHRPRRREGRPIRGFDAAMTAIETANLLRALRQTT